MNKTPRIIDVANDAQGRSHLARSEEFGLQDGADIELWQTFGGRTESFVPFLPPPGESLLRFFVLPPPDPTLTEAGWSRVADGFFEGKGIQNCRHDITRHPLMHATPTEDCVALLAGHAQLLLDDGEPVDLHPFDVVRQAHTNHCWVNLGPGEAVFVALMTGSKADSK